MYATCVSALAGSWLVSECNVDMDGKSVVLPGTIYFYTSLAQPPPFSFESSTAIFLILCPCHSVSSQLSALCSSLVRAPVACCVHPKSAIGPPKVPPEIRHPNPRPLPTTFCPGPFSPPTTLIHRTRARLATTSTLSHGYFGRSVTLTSHGGSHTVGLYAPGSLVAPSRC